MNKVYIASDHAGFDLKQSIVSAINSLYNMVDLGSYNNDSVDYPDYAQKMAIVLKEEPDSFGILICGTGIGINIAANRFSYIRAALCQSEEAAQLAREHNDANIIVFGAKYTPPELAVRCIKIFLATDFTGGRHQNRVEKLSSLVNSKL